MEHTTDFPLQFMLKFKDNFIFKKNCTFLRLKIVTQVVVVTIIAFISYIFALACAFQPLETFV